METMNQGQYDYFAFISYKREDEKWARWLQRKLEYYKLPSSVRKENPDLPDKIRPVFKDTTDLEPGVLAKKIQDALNASQFLIVICSPRSANSVWVSKEVQSFIDSGRADYIIPFIIGGTPNASNPEEECFPEGLRQLAGEQELLGANINEMGRDAAAIKVVARMFDLRFDTLWQRYQRNRKQKYLGVVLFSLLTIATTIFVIFLYLDRTNAYLSLERKNLELNNAYTSLEQKTLELDSAYTDLEKTNNTLSLANLDIINKNKVINQKNDSLAIINISLKEANQSIIAERDNVLRQSREIKIKQLQLISEQAEILFNDGKVLRAYKYIRPYAIGMSQEQYPYCPELASLLNKIKWHLSNYGYKIIDRAHSDDNDIIHVNQDLRYNVYTEEGRVYLYDFRNQSTEQLPSEGRTDPFDVQFSDSIIYYLSEINANIWDIATHSLRQLPKELDYSQYSSYDDFLDFISQYKIPNNKPNFVITEDSLIHISDGFGYLEDEFLNKHIRVGPDLKEFLIGDSLYSCRRLVPTLPSFTLTSTKNNRSIPSKTILYNHETWVLRDYNGIYELYLQNLPEFEWNGNILLIDRANGSHNFICPFIPYSLGNGISYLHSAFLSNEDNVICIAGQGCHIKYDIKTGNIQKFQASNLDSWRLCGHPGVYLSSAFMLDNETLCDVRFCGQITLYDVKTGLIIDEYDIPDDGWLNNGQGVSNAWLYKNRSIIISIEDKYYLFSLPSKLQSVKNNIDEIDCFWKE